MHDHTYQRNNQTDKTETRCKSIRQKRRREIYLYTKIFKMPAIEKTTNLTIASKTHRTKENPNHKGRHNSTRTASLPSIQKTRSLKNRAKSNQNHTLYPYLPSPSFPFFPFSIVASTWRLQLWRRRRGRQAQRLRCTRLLVCLRCLL
jgi:hypothetical protein